MSLQIDTRFSGGVAILDISGRIVAGEETVRLRQTLRETFERGHRHILLNLEGVEYVDSAGLGELVSAYASIIRGGGTVLLLKPGQRFRDLLSLTRLDSVLVVEEDEHRALASFTAAAAAKNRDSLRNFTG